MSKTNKPILRRIATALSFAAYCVWHDLIIHPVCGVLWALRMVWEPMGRAGDRLHCWSTEWPWRTAR